MLRFTIPTLIALTVAGCATMDTRTTDLATAELIAADGRTAGKAVFVRQRGETLVRLTANGVPGAVHGLHLHAVGKCEAPFASAGPHLNPGGHQHGKDNPQGAHFGDLPNITIDSSGRGTASASLGHDSAAIDAALFDADGTAIVLHAAADDYRTDPSGNSGARITCGVLKRT